MVFQFPLSAADVETWVAGLQQSAVSVFPTETFYGLGGNAFDYGVVQRVFACKQRPPEKALLVLIEPSWLSELVVIPKDLGVLLQQCWPGPLTLVCAAKENVPEFLLGPQGTLAVRHSPSPWVQQLLEAGQTPLIGTSANLSGQPNCVTLAEVQQQLGDGVDFWLDGGRVPGGRPSTLLDVSKRPFRILRPGVVPLNHINQFLSTEDQIA